jgi:hypothetical protein
MLRDKSQHKKSLDPLILGIMNENNELSLKILNDIVFLSTRSKRVRISQSTIAAKYDVAREWVNKLLKRWKALGIIKYRQAGFNQSCIYFIHPLLNQEKNRIKNKLPSAALLFAVSSLYTAVFHGEFTLSNIRKYIYRDSYEMVTVRNAGYGFYEQHPSETTVVFFKKQQSTTSISYQPTKESSMENKSVINQISDMYGLSVAEQNNLSGFSEEALQYAFNELKRQNKQNNLNNPVNWIAKVAASYKGQSDAFPKTGRLNDFQKKIVNSSTNNNHSPSKLVPKTSKDERITFVLREIANYEKHLSERRPWLKNVPGGEHLIMVAQNAIANYKRELQDLHYSPDDIQCDAPRYREDETEALEYRVGDKEYEEHLNHISKDKSDSLAYKDLVRKYDYRRTAIKG